MKLLHKRSVFIVSGDCFSMDHFIDIHNHSDFSTFQEPAARNFTSQGVTTLVTGNCGISGGPLTPKNKEIFESEWIDSIQDKLSHWSRFSDFALDLEKMNLPAAELRGIYYSLKQTN